MTAVLIPTASEEDWLAARRNGITASEIAIVMGLSPYSSPYALYHQKLGVLPGPEETDAMRLGSYMEAFVAVRFAELHEEFDVRGTGRELYAHPDRPWQMATPDRLVHQRTYLNDGGHYLHPLAVLECKIDGGSDEWGENGTDEIPVHYRCQVLWQMDVMGVTTGYVACLLWNRRQVRVYELTMDADAKQDLLVMQINAEWFLGRLASQEPPDVDWRPATTLALKALHPSLEDREVTVPATLAARYRAACKAVAKAKQRKALTENQIRARLGSGNRVMDGATSQTLATRQVYDLPEKTITRRGCTVDKLVPAKPKKETPQS